MWKKYGTAMQATNDNIILHMRFSRNITNATITCSEYVLVISFQRPQWLRERVPVLRHTRRVRKVKIHHV